MSEELENFKKVDEKIFDCTYSTNYFCCELVAFLYGSEWYLKVIIQLSMQVIASDTKLDELSYFIYDKHCNRNMKFSAQNCNIINTNQLFRRNK